MAPSSSPSGSQAEIISPPNLGNILTCLANVMIHRSLFHPHYPQFLPMQMVDISLPQSPSPQTLVFVAEVIEKCFSLKSAQQGELERQYRAACYVGNSIDTRPWTSRRQDTTTFLREVDTIVGVVERALVFSEEFPVFCVVAFSEINSFVPD